MKVKAAVLVVLLMIFISQAAFGALNAYLRMIGDTQGDFVGDSELPGREGAITVIATSHAVSSPRDAASGLPTGKRQHRPFTITKEVDRTSPMLMQALVNNENIPMWRLDYWQPSKSGEEKQHYTVELTNASVASIRQEMLNNKYPENMQHREREHVSFVYQEIKWTHNEGNTTANDNWSYNSGGDILISDLTGDGVVNLLDLAIFAQEWMLDHRLR